jgi:biopolymer transport protein ExbD
MSRRSAYRSLSEINITSLVDVTLCLLIIFMLTAPYIQGGVEVDLPETTTREVVVEDGPIITVTKNREVYFDEDLVRIQDIADLLAPYVDRRETVPVYLRADEDVAYGFALQVMAAVEREGFLNLSLVADQELPPGVGR